MKNKLNNIQALRAFAVLLVVGLHLLAIEIKYAEFEVLLPDFMRIGISGVDLFFVISGFIMVVVTQSQPDLHNTHASKFLYLRFSRIFPLYWLVTASILIVYLYDRSLMSFTQFDTPFVLKSFFLQPQGQLPMLMVGWSLIHELYFYCVFAIFLCLPRKRLPWLLLLWTLAVLAGHYLFSENHRIANDYARILFSPLTLEFIAGCYLALYMCDNAKQQNTHLKQLFSFAFHITLWVTILWSLINIASALFAETEEGSVLTKHHVTLALEIAGLLLILFLSQEKKARNLYPLASASTIAGIVFLIMIWNRFSFNTDEIDIEGWPRVYLFTPPFLLLLYGALALERNKQWVAKPWLIAIGDASYSIYLTHILFLSGLGHLWFLIAGDSILDNILMLSLMSVAVIFGGFICFKYVEKPLLKMSHRFTQHFS